MDLEIAGVESGGSDDNGGKEHQSHGRCVGDGEGLWTWILRQSRAVDLSMMEARGRQSHGR